MFRRQLEVFLQFVDYRPSPCVDAEVLKRLLEVGNVGLPLGVEDFPADEREKEEELLGGRQHEGSDGGYIGLQGLAGDHHQVFREGDPHLPLWVFFFVDASVSLVVCSLVGSHQVDKAVLGSPPLPSPVGQKDGGGAHPEQAVGEKHCSLVPAVVIGSDDLSADHQSIGIGVNLKEVSGQIH